MAIAAYRMADEGWSTEDALKEIGRSDRGPSPFYLPHAAGESYEKRFPKHLKDNPVFKGLGHRPDAEQSKK